jgi:hypothetical protein
MCFGLFFLTGGPVGWPVLLLALTPAITHRTAPGALLQLHSVNSLLPALPTCMDPLLARWYRSRSHKALPFGAPTISPTCSLPCPALVHSGPSDQTTAPAAPHHNPEVGLKAWNRQAFGSLTRPAFVMCSQDSQHRLLPSSFVARDPAGSLQQVTSRSTQRPLSTSKKLLRWYFKVSNWYAAMAHGAVLCCTEARQA